MNKNKLIVMFITFAVLIAATPFIFGKLMNSRYNQMLNDLRSKGISINVVKDKSTYLQTDKVLEVSIPSKLLNDNGVIKEIKLHIETKFKNLPVTNVLFFGKLDQVVLSDQYKNLESKINPFLQKYIKFVVTTPNFRDYAYKFDDIVIKDKADIGIKNIKGTFKNGKLIKNSLNIKEIYIKDKKGYFEIKNFKNHFEGNEKSTYSKTNFDVDVNINRFKLQVQNVYSTTKTLLSKEVTVHSSLGFDSLDVPNMANAQNFDVKAQINGIETKILEQLAKAPKDEQEQYLDKIFEKGFNINVNSRLKDAKVMQRDLGGYNLGLNIKFLPTKNFRAKVNSKNIDFVDIKLDLTTTPQIANLIMNMVPRSAFLFALAKKKNGKVVLNLEYKKGQLYSDGQLIK